jgi:hypothetical protein
VTGGVRKRTCTHKVTDDGLRTTDGHRYSMPYCYPPALCAGCYARLGGVRLHDACKEGADRMQRESDAKRALLEAGEKLLISASGDWKDGVPTGMVEATYAGIGYTAHEAVLMPADEYRGEARPETLSAALRVGQLVSA